MVVEEKDGRVRQVGSYLRGCSFLTLVLIFETLMPTCKTVEKKESPKERPLPASLRFKPITVEAVDRSGWQEEWKSVAC